MNKSKICKCGHSKEQHKDKPESKFEIAGNCRFCPCSDYLKRGRPNLSDKIFYYFSIFIIGLFMFLTILIVNIYFEMKNSQFWGAQHHMTNGEFFELMMIIIIGLAIIIIIGQIQNIRNFQGYKTRKTYEVK